MIGEGKRGDDGGGGGTMGRRGEKVKVRDSNMRNEERKEKRAEG